MEISHINMDGINEQSRPKVNAVLNNSPKAQSNAAGDRKERHGDVFISDDTRQMLRKLCESGEAENHVQDIINSGIEPDCLRAELAYRAAAGDSVAVSVLISYLAGDFKEAMKKTWLLSDGGKSFKFEQFLFFSNYFSGKIEKAYEEVGNLPDAMNLSPLYCYAYADLLLSLGYIEEALTYSNRYVMLAKKYLKNFVSEKEKYEEEKKRRENSRRRNDKGKEDSSEKQEQEMKKPSENLNFEKSKIYNDDEIDKTAELLELLQRRKKLLETVKTQNINFDKRPLMFELEDIDAKIAQLRAV